MEEKEIKKVSKFKSFKLITNYISKLFSTAILVLLLAVGAFLIYYFVSNKAAMANGRTKPTVALYTIVSGSMEPTIKVYDVVVDIAVKNPEDIKVGDVITFVSRSSISQNLIVTHRVQDIINVNGQLEYITKGDFNSSADSNTATFDSIIGKATIVLPQLGRLQSFISSKIGWFLVVLLPAMGVLIYDVIKLLKLMNAKAKSDQIEKKETNVLSGNEKIDSAMEMIKKNDYISRLNEIKKMNNSN